MLCTPSELSDDMGKRDTQETLPLSPAKFFQGNLQSNTVELNLKAIIKKMLPAGKTLFEKRVLHSPKLQVVKRVV